MVLSLYRSHVPVTNRKTIDDLPQPVSPNNTTLHSTGVPLLIAKVKEGTSN